MIISILDYGSGNIKSVSKAVEFAATNLNKNILVKVIQDPKKIKESDKIILPGQGSFKQCTKHLSNMSGAMEELHEFVIEKEKKIFGICVGMQLFANFGEEDGGSKGFGWIEGDIKKMKIGLLTHKNTVNLYDTVTLYETYIYTYSKKHVSLHGAGPGPGPGP